jgi:PAS domain S-box-containing protein
MADNNSIDLAQGGSMKLNEFDQQVIAARARVHTLLLQSDMATMLDVAVERRLKEELSVLFEELSVAQEEWRQQSVGLSASGRVIDAERQRYQELFDNAPDGYLVTDAYGTIYEANLAAAKMLQRRADFMCGKPLAIFVHSEDRQTLWWYVLTLRRGQEPPPILDMRLCPFNGTPFPATLSVSWMREAQGAVVRLRWLVRDVSAQKKVEDALRRSRDELEQYVQKYMVKLTESTIRQQTEIAQREKIEDEIKQAKEAAGRAKRENSELVASLSHELRTPLSAILAFAKLLSDSKYGTLTEEQQEFVECVRECCAEVQKHVNSALQVSSLDTARVSTPVTAVRLRELLAEIESEIRERSGGACEWQIEENLPLVYTDADKLKTVVKNLIAHGLKCTDQGVITLGAIARDGGIEISVVDTRIGISPRRSPVTFEPESIEGKRRADVNLGLYIVKCLLELLGGRVTVESEVGRRGLISRVWLPTEAVGSSRLTG